MLKGAIDHISPNEIGGWIYSATASLRNHTVLAFIDDACIGAGSSFPSIWQASRKRPWLS